MIHIIYTYTFFNQGDPTHSLLKISSISITLLALISTKFQSINSIIQNLDFFVINLSYSKEL